MIEKEKSHQKGGQAIVLKCRDLVGEEGREKEFGKSTNFMLW